MALIEVRDLSFSYQIENRVVPVLKNISFDVEAGDFVAIQGPSGSGKSTLFYILGCLLKAKAGNVIIDGKDISRFTNYEMSVFRNRTIGFVFQHFHLLPRASVLENICLPSRYPWELPRTADFDASCLKKAEALAHRLGLGSLLNNRPNQLSGGQQQRVAIARALMHDVRLILADEPTGNLDSANSAEIMGLFKELNAEGKTIILITHDPEISGECGRVLNIRDGVMSPESRAEAVSPRPEPRPLTQKRPQQSVSSPDAHVQRASPRLSPGRLFRAAVLMSWESLKRNKVRSLLTMLGVTIGIASVLAMMTFGGYTKKKILESYEVLGVNKISLWGYQNSNERSADKVPREFKEFSLDGDLPSLKRVFRQLKFVAPVFGEWSTEFHYGGRAITDNGQTRGTSPEYLAISNLHLSSGHFISPYQVRNSSPVCVVGSEVAEKLFLHKSPLGEIMFLVNSNREPAPCEVIGVLSPVSSNRDWNKPNLQVYVPYTYFEAFAAEWDTQLHNILMQAASGADMELLTRKIKAYFRLKYGTSGEFGAGSDTILIAQMKKFLNLFTLLLTSVALVSLTVGGIGINNMMLVSLNERVKEIGLFKALGATDSSVRFQFMMESILLCAIAGTTGVLMGFASYETIIFVASHFIPKLKFEWILDRWALLVSVVAIVAVGLLSGITPAIKAEKLEVIEALRSE